MSKHQIRGNAKNNIQIIRNKRINLSLNMSECRKGIAAFIGNSERQSVINFFCGKKAEKHLRDVVVSKKIRNFAT